MTSEGLFLILSGCGLATHLGRNQSPHVALHFAKQQSAAIHPLSGSIHRETELTKGEAVFVQQ
jgi:hypothetical protein